MIQRVCVFVFFLLIQFCGAAHVSVAAINARELNQNDFIETLKKEYLVHANVVERSKQCSGFLNKDHLVGSQEFDIVIGSLIPHLGLQLKRTTLVTALKALKAVPWLKLKVKMVKAVLQWIPSRISETLPHIQEPWFSEYLAVMLSDKKVQQAAMVLLSSSAQEIAKVMEELYSIFIPYRVQHSLSFSSEDENHIYPYILFHAKNTFQNQRVLSCINKLNHIKDKLEFSNIDQALQLVSRQCVELSEDEKISIITIPDHFNGWLLPLSAHLAIIEQVQDGRLNDELIFENYRGVASFLSWFTFRAKKLGLYRISIPYYLKVLADTRMPGFANKELLNAALFLVGVAYQCFDLPYKKKYHDSVGESNSLVSDAMNDLDIWQKALMRK